MSYIRPLFLDPNPPTPPGGGATPTPTPEVRTGGDSPDTVQLSRAEYDKIRSEAQRATTLEQRAKELETDWSHAEKLLKPSGNPEETAASVRHVLKRAGYNSEEIEQYLQAQQETGGDEEPTPAPKGGRGPKREDELDEVRGTLQEIRRDQAQMEHKRLTGMLEGSVGGTLDREGEVGKLVEDLVKINVDEEDPSAAKKYRDEVAQTLREEIKEHTKKGIAVRRAEAQRLTGNPNAWSDAWISEEAVKAAKAVHSKYRRMTANVDRVGRTPGGAGHPESFILNQKPVPEPKYSRGQGFAEAQAQARNWAADLLLRAVAEDKGGKTAV